ncbi:MAG: hypothetical protein LBL21_01105 [Rickettsiales bacterium]|jgi:hypothetical protein|nr:hypothetical protein [Rickettsiales bacterium]
MITINVSDNDAKDLLNALRPAAKRQIPVLNGFYQKLRREFGLNKAMRAYWINRFMLTRGGVQSKETIQN